MKTNEQDNNQLQSENIQTEQGRNRDTDKQGVLLCSANNSPSCIRYFSMFTGVGGFELGISRSNRDVECSSEEKDFSNSEGNKSISQGSQGQQKGFNNSTDNREIESSQNTSGTLFQNRQEQSNSISRDLESTKRNIETGQQIRQTSSGILSEGNGIRDDSQSLQQSKNCSNIKQFQCVGFSEIDKYANQLLATKFPEVKNYGNARDINPTELPDFDMLCGGFPCQAFSIAGKRKGFDDTRGTLFFEIARIVKVKRPKIVFLENVKGLLNHNKGETFSVIIQTLSELGYDIQWMVLNSKFFGVPQNRERVFIIGSLRGEPRPEILPFRKIDQVYNRKCSEQVARTLSSQYYKQGQWEQYIVDKEINVIGTLETDGWEKRHEQIRRVYGTEGNAPTIPTAQGGGVMTKIAIMRGRPKMPYENGKRELNYSIYEDAVPTLSENAASGDQKNMVIKDMKIRRLTPIECERLQGFPDNWTAGFSDTQRYKMMGNAVTVNVIKKIGEKLI